MNIQTTAPNAFPCLDGLRGIAAFWVLLSHIQILSGSPKVSILSWGGLAVDLFMMLSGLLMAHHYLLRQEKEPWNETRTWFIFWIRRFFRIAPLYYILLVVSFLLSPEMRVGRDAVAGVWPHTATDSLRYTGFEFDNLLAHLTFVFGFLPNYAFRTPLPDWSIGLEMQFYFVFPFVMLAVEKFGFGKIGISLILACLLAKWGFHGFFQQFGMPSFLPIKLYVFMIGIWLAIGRSKGLMKKALFLSLVTIAPIIIYHRSAESIGLLLLVIGIFYLISDATLPLSRWLEHIVAPIRVVLSGKVSRFLGDCSYGLYLAHLLILVPVAGYLSTHSTYVESSSLTRFLICLVIVAPASYLLSWVGHYLVEQPGIRFGKKITFNLRKPLIN